MIESEFTHRAKSFKAYEFLEFLSPGYISRLPSDVRQKLVQEEESSRKKKKEKAKQRGEDEYQADDEEEQQKAFQRISQGRKILNYYTYNDYHNTMKPSWQELSADKRAGIVCEFFYLNVT